VIGPEGYARLVGDEASPDGEVAQYADYAFTYDSGRVHTQAVRGTGAASPDAPDESTAGTFTYAYDVSPLGASGMNVWLHKTTETLPGGAENVVYSNFAGQAILEAAKADGKTWPVFYEHDRQGRVTLTAMPSAFPATGEQYSESQPDLVGLGSSGYQYLENHSGLVHITRYYAASETGGAPGRVKSEAIRHGERGVDVLLGFYKYASFGGVYRPTEARVYPVETGDADHPLGQVTTFDYSVSGAHVTSRTTTLPVVSVQQNGSGVADIIVETYNAQGLLETVSGSGAVARRFEYDLATGALIRTIVDDGGLDLTTEVTAWDNLGRPTQIRDPNGNTTGIEYTDTAHVTMVRTTPPAGPAQVVREDRKNGFVDAYTEAGGTRWSMRRSWFDLGGRLLYEDRYHNIPNGDLTAETVGTETSPTDPTQGNFNRTRWAYDAAGKLYWVKNGLGTITETHYDGLGRMTGTSIGTTSLVRVSHNEYDDGGVGDGNLTRVTFHPGGDAPDRITQSWYDWRGREVATKSGVEDPSIENTPAGQLVNRPITYRVFDNLDHMLLEIVYDGDGIGIGDASGDGIPDAPPHAARRAATAIVYDALGRPIRLLNYGVHQTAGYVYESQKTAFWYDGRGNIIKQYAPGGLVSKTAYDGANRPTAQYFTDGGGDWSWADAHDVDADIVVSQMEIQYDDNGNVVLLATRDRNHDANPTATGPLNAALARTSYIRHWYDAINRLEHSIDYGTNATLASSDQPRQVFDGDDPYLRTDYSYDAGGRLEIVTDPRGVQTKVERDALGRVKKEILGYDASDPTTLSNYKNRTTNFQYDAAGNLWKKEVVLPGDVETRVTEYDYDAENGMLWRVKHAGHTGGADQAHEDKMYYNNLGELLDKDSATGLENHYVYDVLGRVSLDYTSADSENIYDPAAKSRVYRYDTLGRGIEFTTHGTTNPLTNPSPLNQVKRSYNAYGQLSAEYVEADGLVDADTRAVRYAYWMLNYGSLPAAMYYPATDAEFIAGQARSLACIYAGPGNLDARIGRITAVADEVGARQYKLEEYSYLGLSVVGEYNRPLIATGASSMTWSLGGGGNYTDLDGFGRLAEQYWVSIPSSGPAVDVEHFSYGYDAASNVLYKENHLYPSYSELYHESGAGASWAYDKFDNLQQFARGTLTTQGSAPRPNAISGAVANQSWGHTSEGQHRRNMPPDDVKDRPMFQGSFDEEGMEDKLGAWSAGHSSYEPAYALSVRFDMWGNVVEQKDWHMDWVLLNEATLLAMRTYEYDALGRRISEPGRLLYWSADGNVIEDRAPSSVVQYVWSGIGGNHLVLRDADSDANRSTTYDPRLPAGVDERIYAITDASGSVTAITDWAGNVLERYLYTPEGKLEIRTPDMSTVRTNSGYGWGYTYHSGRRDGQGLYYVGGQVYDYLTANPVQPDPASYWGILNEMQPPSLSWYDRTVLFAAPVAIGVVVGVATGGLGFLAAGALGGLTGGFAGGASNAYASGASAGRCSRAARSVAPLGRPPERWAGRWPGGSSAARPMRR
jgi:YD repeat-containing protein